MKIVFDNLYSFAAPLLHSSQLGFTKEKSTFFHLICYLYEIDKNLQLNDICVEALYVDFEKAFDKIEHFMQIEKLKSPIGVYGKILYILGSYLSDQKVFVEVNDYESFLLNVSSGVPQESIAGPILFFIIVIDLPCGMMSCFYCFAADSKMLSIRGHKEICVLSQDVMQLEQWCNKNKVVLNVDKCQLSFSKYHCEIEFTDCPIESSIFEKDLGVIISADLSWNIQFANACKKVSRLFKFFREFARPFYDLHRREILQTNRAANSQLRFLCLVC